MMKNSQNTVTMSIAAALKFRMMFHILRALQTVVAPFFFAWFIYHNDQALRNFDLPIDVIARAIDQTPWWNINPVFLLLGGILLYFAIVCVFHDRSNESGIVNLMNKNIHSEELINVKI